MQKQKTVAKWLVIILLCTLAVGAYILYDALYVSPSGGEAAGGAATPIPEPEPPAPYYTTLPRQSATFAGILAAHAGGEGEDTLLDAVFTADGSYLFFSSSSSEYDCRGAGIYLAFHTDGKLLSVTRFAGAEATFGGAKLTADGVAALTSEDETGRLTLFDKTGNVKGECALPSFDAASPVLTKDGLVVLFAENETLGALTVEEGLSADISPFRLNGGYRVMTVMAGREELLMAAERDGDIAIIRFTENDGFNVKIVYENTAFRQLLPIAGEDGAAYALLGKKPEGLFLAVFGADLASVAETVSDGGGEGVLFADDVSLTLMRTGRTETYCRHLDLISSAPSDNSFGEVKAVRSDSDGDVFVALGSDGRMRIFSEDASGNFESVAEFSPGKGKVLISKRGDRLVVAFSSTSEEGIFFENFGGADAWLVELPRSAATSSVSC